ncbi:uncharacterized protein LOC141629349 [Silene latifolia]|uniref:uncharacterized protein LOC141629349 n=1 Tax=Silene latifolia TaxID=37657 RepID=UPI003D772987
MWLFRQKFHADGSLERYKARLVVNGKTQQVGIDCDETFIRRVKPTTIRTVLSIAVLKSWPIHQLDVKNAFLHGNLNETVYMHQPPGFVDKNAPHHVCKLLAETSWLRNLLLELHVPILRSTLVFCDNISAVYLSGNPVQHQRTKHVELDIHFVRDKVRIGEVRVLHVPSEYQYADIFTKGLPRYLFERFRSSMSVRAPTAPTTGVC